MSRTPSIKLRVPYSSQFAADHPEIIMYDRSPRDQYLDASELRYLDKRERKLLIQDKNNRSLASRIHQVSTIPKPVIALQGATLLDFSNFGKSSDDIPNATVIIQGASIVAAGPTSKMSIPRNAQIIDLSGKFLVPGLIDGFAGMRTQGQACAYFYMGVTTLIGIDSKGRYGTLMLNADPSPRVFRLIDNIGFKDENWKEPLPIAQVLQNIDKAAEQGMKVVLVHYAFPPEAVRAIAMKAHEKGMVVIGELGKTSYSWAMQNTEIDAFVHARRYTIGLSPREMQEAIANDPFSSVTDQLDHFLIENYGHLDPNQDESINLDRYAKQLGSWRGALIPTLSSMYPDLDKPNLWNEPAAQFLDPNDIHFPNNRETGKATYPGLSPQSPFTRSMLVRTVFKLEKKFREEGAHYLVGARSPVWGSMPGLSLHAELGMFREQLGMTPREAIATATENYREVFRWKKLGKIARGSYADLLVIKRDPTIDLENLKQIEQIYQNGEAIDRASLLNLCKK